MPRCHGSFIGVAITPTASVASGIWPLREAQEYLEAEAWPAQPAVPSAPTGTAGDEEVSLTWSAATATPAVTDYIVQYSSNAGSTWMTFSDGTSTSTSATVTGLTNGTGYIFRIIAVNALGQGPYGSASGTITPSGLDVSLLLHFNGANGSDVFTDSGPNALTATVVGDAVLSTAESKFGSASGYFDGNASYVTYPDGTQFAFGSDNFTIEAWVYPTAGSGANGVVSQRAASESDLAFALYVLSGSTYLVVSFNGSGWGINAGGTKSVPDDEWSHIALVRNGSQWRVYVNGEVSQTHTSSDSVYNSTSPLAVGTAMVTNQHFIGYIDELRIVNGTAVYTDEFTPPTGPFA